MTRVLGAGPSRNASLPVANQADPGIIRVGAPESATSALHMSTIQALRVQHSSNTSANWFRLAEFAFHDVKFPHSVLRDESYSNQMQFHRFCQLVVSRRSFAHGLSERQCLRFLVRDFLPNTTQSIVSTKYLTNDVVTISGWLTELRTRFFPGNTFCRTAESYWLRYDFKQVSNLSQHVEAITRLYQMIFSDYGDMVGTLTVKQLNASPQDNASYRGVNKTWNS
jgi:hypothetical protein